jgi:hypothetical protein
VDGAACPFTVAGEDTRWAASGRLELDGHPLGITVQAAGIAPAAIALARLRDPLDTLAP